MFKDDACLEKFVTMLVATSVAGAATGGVSVVPGAAEALTSGSGFLARLSGQRRSDAHRIIRETTTTVRTQWTDWIATSSRTDERDLANAVASFEEVAPRIAPRPADVVGKRLDASAIADLMLARAEVARPEVYADKSPHHATAKLAREFLHELVRGSYALLTANPDYLDRIAPDLWRGVLENLGEIKADTGAIRIATEQIRDDYKREIDFLKDTLHARETDLISLLRIILVRHVPKEDILPALEQSYERLSQLRENWSSLASLANEEPEIAPLLTAADEAMTAGEKFSLETADRALAEADARFQEVNREREEQFKRGEENRARILGKRAELAAVTFDYGGAADLYRQQAECFVKAFGEEHFDTATSFNAAAYNLNAQGRFSDADPLFRKALAIFERVLGEEHPSTASSYNNVASNLDDQGRFLDAEPLYRKALEIRERVLGKEHPSTASSYNNVASNLDAQGRFLAAEPLYRKALAIRERVLGEEHPSTATSYNNVASNLNAQGRFLDAEPLFRKGLEICERVLGEEHPSTASSYNNVASNLDDQGRFLDAEPLYRKALEIRERVLGEEHPDTAASYNNVAFNLNAQGRFLAAEPLYRKALEICERVLGEEHPSTASSYNNVASNLDAQGRFLTAEPLYRKALEICERVLGEEHPDTAKSYNNVASNLDAQGRFSDAEPLYRKALAIRERVLGEAHPDTATSYNNVAYNLTAQGRFSDAEVLYRKALEISERVLGEEHPTTEVIRSNLRLCIERRE